MRNHTLLCALLALAVSYSLHFHAQAAPAGNNCFAVSFTICILLICFSQMGMPNYDPSVSISVRFPFGIRSSRSNLLFLMLISCQINTLSHSFAFPFCFLKIWILGIYIQSGYALVFINFFFVSFG